MWSIGEVKRAAWRKLKKYYLPALAVTLIASIFSGGGVAGRILRIVTDEYTFSYFRDIASWELSGQLFFLVTLASALLHSGIVLLLIRIFIGNPLKVGQCRFFMKSRGMEYSAGADTVFWAFKCGYYFNIVKVMFRRDVYIFLRLLILIIPGIIKSYEYIMVPYILSENPDADIRDIFALTKDMSEENKFKLFLLNLSFSGWIILALVVHKFVILLIIPYIEAAFAEFYASARKENSDFPFHGFDISETPDVYRQTYKD